MDETQTMVRRFDGLQTIEDIMTPLEEVSSIEEGHCQETVLAKAREQRFDIVLHTEQGQVDAVVRTRTGICEPLTNDWLVSRDTPISNLPSLFVASGKPALLVLYGQRVTGLVSPADLNKLPARVYLYHLIGSLETALTRLVSWHIGSDDQALLGMLSPARKKDIRKRMDDTRAGDADVSPVHMMGFRDLVTCITKSEGCRHALGYSSKRQAQGELGGLVHLRNSTMHTTRPLIGRVPNDLCTLHNRMVRAEKLLERLGHAGQR